MKFPNPLMLCSVLACFTLGSFPVLAAAADSAAMVPRNLQCEYRANPEGLDTPTPRLSWTVDTSARGVRQLAYQILVASAPQLLEQDKGDLWDSGRVESASGTLHAYEGAALKSRECCFWKVRVWSSESPGQPGPWSAVAQYSIGLLDPAEWKCEYIGLAEANGDPDFPWLRKTFALDFVPKAARVWVNSLGYYELYINGNKVDDHPYLPAATQLSKRSYYLVHDVARYLTPGKNCIALWLGRGWYVADVPGVTRRGPVARAQLELTGPAGEAVVVATGPDWKARASHITAIGNGRSSHYGGERVDPGRYLPTWADASLDDGDWAPVEVVAVAAHTVCAQKAAPNRIQKRYAPRSMHPVGDKTWVIDFGTNLTGTFDVRFEAPAKGSEVVFNYYDMLVEGARQRDFSQQDVYVSDGEPEGRFTTRFNYHAFRYVKITGLDRPPREDGISAALVHSDFEPTASFACSNAMLNDIHDMVFYTLRCLSVGSFLVDCPHIERLGYGGDGLASTPTALTMFNMGALYNGWFEHWRDCQRESGDMPHTAPNPWNAGGGPFWCSFIVNAPHYMASLYNDRRVLENNYAAMQHWLDGWVESQCKDDLLMGWPNQEYRNWYLGDWAQPGRGERAREKSTHLVNNCVRIHSYAAIAGIAAGLGKDADADRYRAKAEALRPKVHAAFYDADKGTYADDTQIDLAYALLVDIAPEAVRDAVIRRLEDNILNQHSGHLDVGLVGIPVMVDALLKCDRSDLMFPMLNTDTFPGYGHMLKNGATTTWEHWDGDRSHIHNCYNGIGTWFYRGLGGILPDAELGYLRPTFRPAVVGDVTWAKARQETVAGTVQSHWRILDGRFLWDIEVPPGVERATVMVPAKGVEGISESGKPAAESPGITAKGVQGRYAVFEVGPGRYAFSAPWPQG